MEAGSGGNGEAEAEGVGVLEGDRGASGEGTAVVEEAVVVAKAAEHAGVDETGRAEPPAAKVDASDAATPPGTHIQHLHRVRRDSIRQRRRRPLVHHDIVPAALLAHSLRVRWIPACD